MNLVSAISKRKWQVSNLHHNGLFPMGVTIVVPSIEHKHLLLGHCLIENIPVDKLHFLIVEPGKEIECPTSTYAYMEDYPPITKRYKVGTISFSYE